MKYIFGKKCSLTSNEIEGHFNVYCVYVTITNNLTNVVWIARKTQNWVNPGFSSTVLFIISQVHDAAFAFVIPV